MKFQEVTRENLNYSLHELLFNPYYKTQVNRVSKIFKDRPLSAMDTAMYWVDYIIRHEGALHNRSKGLDLKWYEYYLLDIILLGVMLSLLLLVIICIVLRKVSNVFRKVEKVKTK